MVSKSIEGNKSSRSNIIVLTISNISLEYGDTYIGRTGASYIITFLATFTNSIDGVLVY